MSQEAGSTASVGSVDSPVFWVVNAFIFVVSCAACAFYCCCFQGTGNGRPGMTESDRIYHDTILRRQQEALDRKRESPQVRQHNIEQAILRYGLRMVVQEEDLTAAITSRPAEKTLMIKEQSSFRRAVGDNDSTSTGSSDDDPANLSDDSSDSPGQSVDEANVFREQPRPSSLLELHVAVDEITPADVCCRNNNFANEAVDIEMGVSGSADAYQADWNFEVAAAVEECESGYLMLPCLRQVPNCCAICLCPYDVAETVIWSDNNACKHAFHEECISQWLVKQHEGTSCPCCRQEFLPNVISGGAKHRPVTGAPRTFNASAISFR